MDLFVYKKEMLSLMEAVQVSHQKYTLAQVMQNLRKYVTAKKLLSPSDPTLIVLGDDPLASLFSLSTFDLKKTEDRQKLVLLMTRHLEQCRPNAALPDPAEEDCKVQGIKRKISSTDFDEPVSSSHGPMYLQIPPSPVYDSGQETTYSLQDYPTEEACNSGSNYESEDAADFKPEKTHQPHGEASVNLQIIVNCPDPHWCSPVDSAESDVAFWADRSGNDWWSDLEPSPTGKWQCGKCSFWNERGGTQCQGCHLAVDCGVRAVSKKKRKKRLLSKGHRQRIKQAQDSARLESARSSQEAPQEEEEAAKADTQNKCIICVTRNASALILHGQTAHNVCCYGCARKLQKYPNTCPTCRREIDRVVHFL